MRAKLALLFGALVPACSLTVDWPSFSEGGALVDVDASDARDANVVDADESEVGSDAAADADAELPCAAPGDRCADSTVVVAKRNGGTLYAMPCDLGQTWNGADCTGERVALPYNAGNQSGGVFVGATSADDGLANTNALVAADADSLAAGVQPHIAAQTCHGQTWGGHADWYLPARMEVEALQAARFTIGHFDGTGAFYKTSTETHDSSQPLNAVIERFTDGYQYGDGDSKPQTALVRCLRFQL